jgi:hypothetical protein
MNERIEELMRKADDVEILVDEYFCDTDFLADVDPRRVKVFAELIVQECIDIVAAGGEFASRPKLVEKLQEHFGVEE